MIDIKLLKENPELFKEASKNKNVEVDIDLALKLLEEKSDLLVKIEAIRKRRNETAEKVKLEARNGKINKDLIAEGKVLKEELDPIDTKLTEVEAKLTEILYKIPNPPSEDTPVGKDEAENKILRTWGEKPRFVFEPLEHWQLGEKLDILDFERAAKVTGTRFSYIKGKLALLEFALIQYAFSVLTNQEVLETILKKAGLELKPTPFIPIIPPVFIRPEVFQKMARLEPKEERYYIESDDQYLIGSAEHTLGPMHMDETFEEGDLPRRYAGFSTSFRRESGSYGKDTKGILRVHQFDKVEIESFTLPEDSIREQDFFVAIQEHLMQSLNIPYQVIITSTGDMGDPDARHLDIESWLPGQGRYRETHSADLMTDYQARRLGTKVKHKDGTLEFVHTNDATAYAMSRTLIAIMENYQQKDGSIMVPEVLVPYTGFKEITS